MLDLRIVLDIRLLDTEGIPLLEHWSSSKFYQLKRHNSCGYTKSQEEPQHNFFRRCYSYIVFRIWYIVRRNLKINKAISRISYILYTALRDHETDNAIRSTDDALGISMNYELLKLTYTTRGCMLFQEKESSAKERRICF